MLQPTKKQLKIESLLKKLVDDRHRLDAFESVFAMYQRSRGRGHTTLMLDGINNWNSDVKPILIIATNNQREHFTGIQADIITLTDIDMLMSYNEAPIAWDNFAIIHLCQKAHVIRQDLEMLANLIEEK